MIRTPKVESTAPFTVPDYWQLRFNSIYNNEKACGTKTIPQILGRMWFLRNCVLNGSSYKIVQLTQASYIGIIENVAGFNVLFQVNSDMTFESSLLFFPSVSPQVPWPMRKNTAGSDALVRRFKHRSNIPETTILAELNVFAGIGSALLDLKAPGTLSEESTDLIRRAQANANSHTETLQAQLNVHLETRDIESAARLMNVFKKRYIDVIVTPFTAFEKAQLASAVWDVKFKILRLALASLSIADLKAFFDNAIDTAKREAAIKSVDLVVIAKFLPDTMNANTFALLMSDLVPNVFATSMDLALFAYACPDSLLQTEKDDYFSSNEEREGKKQWVTRHKMQSIAPATPLIATLLANKGTELVNRTTFADWVINSIADSANLDTIAESASYKDALDKNYVT
eukprot:3939809-Rhodomonas_salina.1